MAGILAEALRMSCRLKLPFDELFAQTVLTLVAVTLPWPCLCAAAATDLEKDPPDKTSAPYHPALVHMTKTRRHHAEVRRPVSSLKVSVYVFNSANIATRDLINAEDHAAGIFENVGIKITWVAGLTAREGPGHSVAEAWNRADLDVRIWTRQMPRSPALPSNALGYCLSMEKGQAVVLSDAIQDLASSWGIDTPDILGLAMAHEIGHLLLQTTAHSYFGVSRLGSFNRTSQVPITAS
jgi:hypothetical protein